MGTAVRGLVTHVVGVDGTSPEGWLVVELQGMRLEAIQQLATLDEVLEAAGEAEVVAVDLAIGHDDPEGTRRGGKRACDVAARDRYGDDRPDLPLVPPPSLLELDDLEAAQRVAEDRGWVQPTHGLWRLKDRLLALDQVAENERLIEVRTELSFEAMQRAQGREGQLPTPPHAWKGLVARLKLLAEEGLRPARSVGGVGHLSPKDAAGASAAAWTAHRIAQDEATSLLDDPPEDPRTGRLVTIWS